MAVALRRTTAAAAHRQGRTRADVAVRERSGAGGVEDARWRGWRAVVAARAGGMQAAWNSDGGCVGERRRLRRAMNEQKSEGSVREQETYDRWAPLIFLTPVKPMPRFRTPVDCIGSVHPRLQQKPI